MEATERPSFFPFRAVVAEKRRLAPHFMRVTFEGAELRDVLDAGYDQRIKVLLSLADDPRWERSPLLTDECREQGLWWDVWRGLPLDRRPVMRTYTVRAAGDGRVVVDFVLHDDAGPAGTFAANARPGDMAVLVAPDARSAEYGGGIDFHPGDAGEVLLVGDETAAPAIGGILRSLAESGWNGSLTALIEVPCADDRLDLPVPGGTLTVEWIPRDGNRRGALLGERVNAYLERLGSSAGAPSDASTTGDVFGRAQKGEATAFDEPDVDRDLLWETPDDARLTGFYAWTAGEAAMVRDIRRILLRDHGLDRSRAAFMGYWRDGKAEL
ncbi:siderophore-interacting protein [Bifidobacterium sp. 82T10]|uniref:Siderophore-interacting protein n=1 Tax=Bifidobacterium miconis TaxID=2834435 RepID=A0ABS6WBW7_9BIFI|nr:siderophore-interacting protein [Bifidobacterium miconis]MBW3091545.1 siderophore-interacting protein [Bifidobacterium miconis]